VGTCWHIAVIGRVARPSHTLIAAGRAGPVSLGTGDFAPHPRRDQHGQLPGVQIADLLAVKIP